MRNKYIIIISANISDISANTFGAFWEALPLTGESLDRVEADVGLEMELSNTWEVTMGCHWWMWK
jgi:hypothetical protein